METQRTQSKEGRPGSEIFARLKAVALFAGLAIPSEELLATPQAPAAAAIKSGAVPQPGVSPLVASAPNISDLRAHAAKGDPKSMYVLGLALRDGQGVSPNLPAAQELLLRAARLGHASAQTEYARMLLSGEGFKQPDRVSARQWLQAAAAQGDIDGIRILAKMLRFGTEGERDINQANTLLERAAKLGCMRSKVQMASILREQKRLDEALKLLKECSEKGDVDAQSDLATWLIEDHKAQEALPWLKKAAIQGDAISMITLAALYLSGEGVHKDIKEGERWFQQAVATGSALAQFEYASALLPGGDLPTKPQEAARLLRIGAERGFVLAQFALAQCYLEGIADPNQPLTKNTQEATTWLRKAAAQGYAPACDLLAHTLMQTAKTAADHAEVNTLLKSAADNGFASSQLSYSERLRQGTGVAANKQEADRYLDLALKQEMPHAIGRKGLLLIETGDATKKTEGLSLLKRAAEMGEAMSQSNLGMILVSDDKHLDLTSAFAWTKRAARQGLAQAQHDLGIHYERGDGVAQDRAAALLWYQIAANNGLPDSLPHAARLSILLGKQASDKIIAKAREFKPEPEELRFDQTAVLTSYNESYLHSRFGSLQISRGNTPLSVLLERVDLEPAKEKLRFASDILSGEIASPSMAPARSLLQNAAEHGYTPAMLELGKLLRVGAKGVTRDSAEAIKWLKKSADAGLSEAQCLLATMYDQGVEVPSNTALAIDYYRKAADQGDASALFRVAQFHMAGTHVAPDEVLAARMFRGAADLGHSGAQFELSRLLRKSESGSPNIQEGWKFLELSAQQGHANAQNELGLAFRDGLNGTKDTRQALHWFEAAAAQDLARALFNAAVLYDLGEGVSSNPEKAYRYYQRAAEQGLASARYNLGLLLQSGAPGAPKNISGALALYEQAARQGHIKAQFNLGALLMNSDEGTRDLVKAHAWLNIAAANQHPKAAQFRDRVEAHLSAAQRVEAEKLVAEFLASSRSDKRN